MIRAVNKADSILSADAFQRSIISEAIYHLRRLIGNDVLSVKRRTFRVCYTVMMIKSLSWLFKLRCASAVRYNFFTERVIAVWNNLPSTVNFATLTTFRRTIAGVDLSKYIKSTRTSWFLFYYMYFLYFHGRWPVSCGPFSPVHRVFSPYVLYCFEQTKMYVCIFVGLSYAIVDDLRWPRTLCSGRAICLSELN